MNDNSFDDPEIAKNWIQSIEGDGGRIREGDIYPLLRDWIGSHQFQEILEIGCGQGAASITAPDKSKYTGIDPSPLLLARANELYTHSNREFKLGNAYSLPFSDNYFDAIFSVTVWHLLKDIQRAASELSRTLIAGGKFLIVTANPEAYLLWDKIFTESKLDGNRLEGTIIEDGKVVAKDVLYLHTSKELLKSFQNVNLSILETTTFRTDKESGLNRFIGIFGQKLS